MGNPLRSRQAWQTPLMDGKEMITTISMVILVIAYIGWKLGETK